MAQSTTIVAFDQHADSVVAAVLPPAVRVPVVQAVPSDVPALGRFVDRLAQRGPVRCYYEAGPCGFALQRALTARGFRCDVIAPALMPRRPGDRVKTDRRDAAQLALMARAGALTVVHVPTEQEEAVRDLLRCREDIRADLLRARHRLSKFLLRHGRRFTATRAWSVKYWAWLRQQTWSFEAQTQTHLSYLRTIEEALARLRTVDEELRTALQIEPLKSRVARLRCFRGIDDLTALTIAAELGDPRRFARPRQVMGYVGLVPSEHSSGAKRRQGGITKTGNAHLRRVLVEAAWHYRHAPRVGRALADRQRGQPEPIVQQAWAAQQRLFHRYRRLTGRGKRTNVVITAVARELTAFAWAALVS
jgi:transposase